MLLAIDREQIKEDFEALQFPILGIVGGIIGIGLATASIFWDHILFDILYWSAILAGAFLFLNNLYERYTVSESGKNVGGNSSE
ncbi:hypothetical protein [Natrinema salinisoli]|uniref:hypothetical protein n=1 Tax=Natrinema salinisoli TaxID=2878535 RepID=UPI001CF088BE|nr:hypothetical protein [Natrinema salinisoli]